MPRDVRTHKRRTPSGRQTTVRHHTRRGESARPGKPRQRKGPNPGHAWKLTKRARAHHRRGRKGIAAVLVVAAVAEVITWFTLSSTSIALGIAAGALGTISYLLIR